MVLNKKKKILLAVHNCTFSGAPLLGVHLAEAFAKRGYHVFIICLEKGILYKQFKKSGTIFHAKSLWMSELIIRMLVRMGIRSVICNTVVTGDIAEIAYKKGLTVITMIHELPEAIKSMKAERKAEKITAFSKYVIFPNYFVKDKFVHLYKINRDKILVKPQGLYMKIHKGYDEKTKFQKKSDIGIGPNERIVIGIGYGSIIKGIDLFFKVASNVHQRDKSIRFIWIGDVDAKFNWVIRMAERKGILLMPPSKHIEDYYRIADLYLLTSREDSFPSTVLEAIAYGIPVLGFKDAGGFSEIDPKYIKLADYLDCDGMADYVIDITSNNNLQHYFSRDGKQYIKKNFDFQVYADFLAGLL